MRRPRVPVLGASSDRHSRKGLAVTWLTPRTVQTLASLVFVSISALLVLNSRVFLLDGTPYVVLGDDAMISMRYAYNFAAGLGLYWNPGGSVEGYSNLLLVLIMSVVHSLGAPVNTASGFVIALNTALAIGCIHIAAAVCRRLGLTDWTASLIGAILVLNPQFLLWSVDGFETTIVCTITLLGLWALMERRFPLAATAFAVGVLTRDDYLLVPLTLSASLAATSRPAIPRWQIFFRIVSLPVAALLAHTLFRLAYYGDPLPNTYYLKATGWPLGSLLIAGATYAVGMLVPFVFASYWLIRSRSSVPSREAAGVLIAAPALFGVYTLYVIRVAGDAFPGSRLYAPVWCHLALAVGLAIRQQARGSSIRRLLTGTLLVFVMTWGPFERRAAGQYLREFKASAPLLMQWQNEESIPVPRSYESSTISSSTPPQVRNVALCETVRTHSRLEGVTNPSMAAYYAGVPPYICHEFRAVDLLGKSDAVIARRRTGPGRVGHNKWDYEWSLGTLKPDYLLSLIDSTDQLTDRRYRDQPLSDFNWQFLVDSPAFLQCYASNPIPGIVPLVFVRETSVSAASGSPGSGSGCSR